MRKNLDNLTDKLYSNNFFDRMRKGMKRIGLTALLTTLIGVSSLGHARSEEASVFSSTSATETDLVEILNPSYSDRNLADNLDNPQDLAVNPADDSKSNRTKHRIRISPYVGGTFIDLRLSGLDFAEGYGEEPNHPKGWVLNIGGQAVATIGDSVALKLGGAYPIYNSDFRDGFTDRNRWSPPGWGETYTYSRVSKIDPIYWVGLGWQKVKPGVYEKTRKEFGVKLTHINLTLEQGLDAWNRRNPKRSFKGNGLGWSLYYQHERMLFELGPFYKIDFENGGSGKTSAFSVAFSY